MKNTSSNIANLEESLHALEQDNASLLHKLKKLEHLNDVLGNNQRRYTRILNAITDYVYSVTVNKNVCISTIHEPGCLLVTGYTPEEFLANKYLWIDMVHEKDRDSVKDQAAMAISGQPVAPLEHRIIRKDGEIVWVKNTIVLNKDDTGNLSSYDGIIRDITARKTNERALEHYREHLEKLVWERTQELTQLAESLREEINERKKVEKQIRHLALHDNLTGLPNRRLLFDRLEHALEIAKRNQSFVGMLFIDLNGFKNINDTCGHDYGDRVLIEVARRLEKLLRKTDTVARFGGDEFVVLLEGFASTEYIADVAAKILETIKQPFNCGDYTFTIGSSIGISAYPDDAMDPLMLLRYADNNMYNMKKNTPNQCKFSNA